MFNKDIRKEAETRTLSIKRVAKVTPGSKRLRFSVMVIAGNRNGSVGVALGRGVDTKSAIEKAERKAIKNMKKIDLVGDTVPHEVYNKFGAAKVLLRPAKPGVGIIAGSSSRLVLELAGVMNVYCKQLGTNNSIANAYATFNALKKLRSERVLKKMRIMQERVGLKEKIDTENKKKLAKKRAEKKTEKKVFNKKNNISEKKNVSRKIATKKK